MENDTVVEQPVNSIADDLSAAFEEAEAVEASEDIEESEEVSLEAAEDVTEEPEEAPEIEALSPPDHWSSEDKETFKSAPREMQEWALRRHKEMEGDYTRGKQEIADFKKTWEPVQQLYAPYMDNLRSIGLTPQQHIERLVNADLLLNRDPVAGIQQVAKMYGVDLSQIDDSFDEVSPEVSQLRNELATLRSQIDANQRESYTAKQNTIVSQIEEFASETDEQGNPLRPHFEEVIDDIVLLAQAERAAGREPILKDLYDKAVWTNPTIRSKVLAAEKAAESKKAEEEAIAKAAKAKQASKSVNGSPGGAVPNDDLSLREQLANQFG